MIGPKLLLLVTNLGKHKWNLSLFQQLEDFHFISEIIVQVEEGPEIKAFYLQMSSILLWEIM
jgi:hypothetical protein